MRIGHVAQILGIRPSRIRYYEDAGLLPPPPRISGRRDYGREAVDRLMLVLAAQRACFTLSEIRELVSLIEAGNLPNVGWQDLAVAKIEKLDATIFRLQSARCVLVNAIGCNCAGVAADCKLISGFPPPSEWAAGIVRS